MVNETVMPILEARYLKKDEFGNVIETPEEMFMRVASFLNPEEPKKYFDLMNNNLFMPNTPTLINAGKANAQLSACFVLPIEDSMESIFTTIKNTALIHKTGGGTGFSFSRLRPAGARVHGTSGVASGPISFLHVFNAATEVIKQGGVRRGANMGVLRIDHPDIEEFIMCKDDPNELNNFNLSVAVTDDFMRRLEGNANFELVDPTNGRIVKNVRAVDIWKKIVHQAWKNGEPGILFIDKINYENPTPEYGDFEATNPCGEQPLLPYESCNLGSINLSEHVDENGEIDYGKLANTTEIAVHFLNDVLDHNVFPLPEIREATLRTRKIGLGVMGFADMLLKMGIKYSSPEAREVAKNVMNCIRNSARAEGLKLKTGKNATLTTIAPTGTISMIAGASSGIEPNFSWVYTRNSCDKVLYIVHPIMEKKLKEIGRYTEDILKQLEKGIPVSKIPGLENLGNYWETSQEIAPENHILMQAAFQAYTDNAVSKTINLPSTATEADVESAYMLAYYSECKGITVYRDGSRASQVLNHSEDEKDISADANGVRIRPKVAYGSTEKKEIGCGTLYVTVNRGSDDYPIEIFTNTGKAGGCPAQSEGLARMVSLALRYGIPVEAISKQLCGIRCMSTIRKKNCDVLSCPDAIGKALKKAVEGREKAENPPKENPENNAKNDISDGLTSVCPECGAKLEQAEGCVICHSCGYSKCG